jgi:hypothetical protein
MSGVEVVKRGGCDRPGGKVRSAIMEEGSPLTPPLPVTLKAVSERISFQ